jgi:HK97 family phage portal protein
MLLARYIGRNPFDDRWYTGGSTVHMTDASSLSLEGALKISTVYRAINVLAAAVAVLPVDVLQRKGRRGWKPLEGDLIRTKLRLAPNRYQTSYRWRHHLVGHLLLGGNYYAHKYAWGTPQLQINPLAPERMRIVDVENDGSLLYEYTTARGERKDLTTDDLVHSRGFSTDGMRGVSVIDLMRENTQLAAMNRQQRTAFVKNAMRPSVLIRFPKGQEIGAEAERNVLTGYARATSGRNAGRPLVLGDGAEISAFGFDSKAAQYIESEYFLVEEFLRFLGVPGVLVNYPDKTATFASAEAFFQSFVDHGVAPITVNLEQELTTSLYGVQEDIRVRFNLNALLRGDSTARAAFYRTLVELGIFTRNEIRELENRNPLKGLDEPLTPKNMGGASPEGSAAAPPAPAAPAPARRPAPPTEDEDDEEETRASLARAGEIVREAAARVVRRELAAILGGDVGTDGKKKKGAAERYAKDPAGWRAWVTDFYGRHVELVTQVLRVPTPSAEHYCQAQAKDLLAGGVGVVESWEAKRVPYLVEVAMAPVWTRPD